MSGINTTEQYANNVVEPDHGRLEARLRPIRGLKGFRSARILGADHAFVQNLRRGHYEIAVGRLAGDRLCAGFDELMFAI